MSLLRFLLCLGIVTSLPELTQGQFLEKSQETICDQFNPIYSCYATLEELFANTTENAILCPGIAEYYNCSHQVACQCGLTRAPNVYQSLAYMVQVFHARGCQPYAELVVEPGMECPDYPENSHVPTREEEQVVALTLAASPDVASLESSCSGLRPCYAALDYNLSRALYRKDLPAMCSHLSDFIQCMERAMCVCGKAADSVLINVLESERATYHQTCSLLLTSIPALHPINCTAHGIDACETANPIYACSAEFDQEVEGLSLADPRTCKARRDFVECAEATACLCGVTTSTPVLRAITIKIGDYRAFGCAEVEGTSNLTVTPGIQCDNNVTGSSDEAAEISLGLALAPEVALEEARCPGIEICYRQADTDGGVALYNKNLSALCRVQDNFIQCGERIYCHCGRLQEEEVQDWATYQRSLRLFLCDHVLPGFSEYECSDSGEGTDVTVPTATSPPRQNAPAVRDMGGNSSAAHADGALALTLVALTACVLRLL